MGKEKCEPGEKAVNLCDILGRFENVSKCLNDLKHNLETEGYDRIYMGSYFCDHYFIQTGRNKFLDVIGYASEQQMKVTLVIPPVFQANYQKVLGRIEELLNAAEGIIDEITINDWGMSELVSKHDGIRVNMGRDLQKDNRDPRYQDYYSAPHTHRCFTEFYMNFLKEREITGLELDCTHMEIIIPDMKSGIGVAVHGPYCYMSLGSICVYASMRKDENKKFHYADVCGCECNRAVIKMSSEEQVELYRIGRSVMFASESFTIQSAVPYRYIYFPLKEIMAVL